MAEGWLNTQQSSRLRIEQGAGLTAYFANGGRGQLSDYLPQRTADEEAALDRAMKEWR